jgi:MFS family permease
LRLCEARATSRSVLVTSDRISLGVGGLAVLTLGALDFGLEQSIILPALPGLARHYDASLLGVAWLATGFLLASIGAIPLFGRLGDVFGKRRMLLVSLTAFALGSLICALTHSLAVAIGGRAIQGLGSAIAPLTLGLVRDTVRRDQLPRAIGGVIGAANVGAGIGFLLSGVLVDVFSPAAIFWFLFIFAGVLAAAISVLVHESPVRTSVRLDSAGALLVSAGLATLLLAISKGSGWGWHTWKTVGLFAAAVALLALFALVEQRVPQPLVDLGLVVRRPFARTNLCAFVFGFTFFIAIFVLPQIAATPKASGYGLELSTTEIGLLLVPTSVAGLAASSLGGRVVDRFGSRALVAAGGIVGVAGYVSLALWHNSVFALGAASAGIGSSWGLILTGIYPVVLRGASADKTAVAPAVTLVFRNLSVSLGVTVAFVLISDAGYFGSFRAEIGYTRAFVLGAAGAAFAVLTAMLLPSRRLAGLDVAG